MKKKQIIVSCIIVAIVLALFVVVYFEPQSALINKKSDQAQKGSVISRTTTTQSALNESVETSPTTTASAEPGKSTWVSREHTTTGEVFLTRDASGTTFVRFENLNTSNGPDLKVYIAKSLSSNGSPSDFVDLGDLVANKGNANYEVPSNVDISEYSHVVIWCKRFSVSFADATI